MVRFPTLVVGRLRSGERTAYAFLFRGSHLLTPNVDPGQAGETSPEHTVATNVTRLNWQVACAMHVSMTVQ